MADAETVRRQRQKQLEDKRRKLAELRRIKEVNNCHLDCVLNPGLYDVGTEIETNTRWFSSYCSRRMI